MPTTKKHVLLTVYLGLVSLIAFIGLAITVIVFSHKVISTNIITEDEYVSRHHREIDRCEEPIYIKDDSRERTEAETEECITKAKSQLILQRNVDKKETMILSGLRGLVLLIIFPLHFVYFRKYNK